MKILCFILSILLISLTTVPCCSEDNYDVDTIATEQTEHNEDSCTNCPPMLACGTCVGFVFQPTSFSFQPIAIDGKTNITPWKDGTLLMCTMKIWQPPKLA